MLLDGLASIHTYRGIIGGVGHPANTRKQQRFVPQVTKVVENIEEETPRRFIIGMAAGNNHQVVGAKTATHDEQNNPAAMIAPCAQSSSTSVAAVAAAAAAAAAAASFTASTAASESAAPDRGETSQSHKENVANSELPQVAVRCCFHFCFYYESPIQKNPIFHNFCSSVFQLFALIETSQNRTAGVLCYVILYTQIRYKSLRICVMVSCKYEENRDEFFLALFCRRLMGEETQIYLK